MGRVPRPLRPLPVIVLASLALVAAQLGAAPGASAAESCTDTPVPGYTVRVCLVSPDSVATPSLAGTVAVSARVEILAPSVTPPTVSKVIFGYRDGYLLSDHDPEYAMSWRTTRLVDGPGTFEVKARLSDDVVARHVVPLSLLNGITVAPPANAAQFTVRQGTQPAPGQRFRVVAVGDGADGGPREAQVVDRISAMGPNLLAYTGDVYERGSPDEFDNWYGGTTGYGRFRDITNPVIGNHEYLTPGAAGYFGYWDNVPHYYSYNVAGWHVAAIDSSVEFDQLRPGTAQYEWLAADLGANRAHCTMVYMHHPRWSVALGGGRTGLGAVWALMADRRVTLAVAGHAHSYERWLPLDRTGAPAPRGVTQLVAGAGGHEIVPGVLSDPRLASTKAVSGALRIDLGSEDASFAYVGADGSEYDAGTVGCTSTGDTFPPSTPSGLLASATSATTAQLAWSASTDEFGATGYTVRRDGAAVATLGAGATAYAESGLTSGSTYTWTVDAFDASQNVSPQSVPASLTMPAPPVPRISSRTMLRQLVTAPETGRGYRRSAFRTWTDVDGDSCDTRSEVLVAEAVRPPTLRAGCGLTGGRWFSRYDGVTTTQRAALGIEHLVPLREVWQSGGRGWTALSRRQMANDLGYPYTVNVATARVIRAKGSAEPRTWMPSVPRSRCAYVAEWVAVKWRWHLRVDRAERRHLAKKLAACGWPTVVLPTRPKIIRR